MKPLFAFSLVIVCGFMAGCSSNVTFQEPQPPDGDKMEVLPKKICGEYVSKVSGYHHTIDGKMIRKSFEWKATLAKKDLDSNFHLQNNMLINADGSDKYPVQINGDSLQINIHFSDTTFAISDKGVVKRFKGYFFLNQQTDSSLWVVTKLTVEKGVLYLGSISSTADIDKLRQITETNDTATFNFQPTQKQFHKFIKQKGFSDVEEYVKIRN